MYFRIWLFILRNKWSSNSYHFSCENNGVEIIAFDHKRVDIRLLVDGSSNTIHYEGFAARLIHWHMLREEKRQKRLRERRLTKEIHATFKSIFKTNWHRVEINMGDEEKSHNKIRIWLKTKTYEYHQRNDIYYFANKEQAMEFRLRWA